MEQQTVEKLYEAGIQVEQARERLLNNDPLLERFLKKFLEDGSYGALCTALEHSDWEGALRASHALKGLTANLAMNELSELCAQQVQCLRAGDHLGAQQLQEPLAEAYQRVAAAIREKLG